MVLHQTRMLPQRMEDDRIDILSTWTVLWLCDRGPYCPLVCLLPSIVRALGIEDFWENRSIPAQIEFHLTLLRDSTSLCARSSVISFDFNTFTLRLTAFWYSKSEVALCKYLQLSSMISICRNIMTKNHGPMHCLLVASMSILVTQLNFKHYHA